MVWQSTGDSEPPDALAAWATRGLGRLREAGEEIDAPFEVVSAEPDLEIASPGSVRGRPNRARLRVRDYGDGKLGVVFFKVSSVPGSGDRFGYGGLAVRADRLRPEHLRAWLRYLASGCDGRQAPRGLRPEFQFPVID